MGGFIITLSLFVTFIFPILISLLGISYFGSESSPIYILTVVGVNALALLYVIVYEIFNHRKAAGFPIAYCLPLVFVAIYLFEYAVGWISLSNSSFLIFRNGLAISMIGIIIGTFTTRYNKFEEIFKNTELLMLICSVSMILALPSMYSSGYGSSIGGAGGHQTISYTAAFAFGITYYRVRFNPAVGYKLFLSHIYKYVAYILMLFQFLICIIGGGRGGVVLLIVLVFFSILYSRGSFVKPVILAAGCLLMLWVASNIPYAGIGDMIASGAERAFSFIGDSSIDLAEGSSGRDYVYERAIALISEKPVFGYGFFRQYDLCSRYIDQPYSHNLFLELMLQGGVVLCCAGVIILCVALFCTHSLIRMNNVYFPLISMAGFPFVMLMFSGSYYSTPLFWFVLIFVLMEYNKKRKTSVFSCKSYV